MSFLVFNAEPSGGPAFLYVRVFSLAVAVGGGGSFAVAYSCEKKQAKTVLVHECEDSENDPSSFATKGLII